MILPLLSLIYDNWLPGSFSQRRLSCWAGMAAALCSLHQPSPQPPIVLSLSKTPNYNAFHASGFWRSLLSGGNLPPLASHSSQSRRRSLVFISFRAGRSLHPPRAINKLPTRVILKISWSLTRHCLLEVGKPLLLDQTKQKRGSQRKSLSTVESFVRGQLV